eukprot:scaffold24034_cov58-Attheya_sp.AAC.2
MVEPTRTYSTSIGNTNEGTSNGINDNLNGSFPPQKAFNMPGQSVPSYKDTVLPKSDLTEI